MINSKANTTLQKKRYAKRAAKAERKGYDPYHKALERNKKLKQSKYYKFVKYSQTHPKQIIAMNMAVYGTMAVGAVYLSKQNKAASAALRNLNNTNVMHFTYEDAVKYVIR